jgi:peptidoglycan hydrolase-like protein with peptidoglycan-binding domain
VADALVVALQQELNRRGFNAGVVDGLIGPQTIGAISAAQSSFNMLIDGKPSEALLRALRRH